MPRRRERSRSITPLAAALSKAAGRARRDRLPFDDIEFSTDAKTVRFDAAGKRWKCELDSYDCNETGPARKKDPEPAQQRSLAEDDLSHLESPWVDGPEIEQPVAFLQPKKDADRARSPDTKWTAFVMDANIHLRDADGKETPLTKDGKEGQVYGRLAWSPDSKALVAFRVEPGERKEVHILDSSPPAGGRAVLSSRTYDLPGDKFTSYELHVFDIESKKDLPVEDRKISLATNYEQPRLRWNKDGRTFTYQRTERGHQRFRLVEVDSHTGTSRNLIDEKTNTFIWTAHTENLNVPLVSWLQKTDEIIHLSEKSGWRHLYLIDAKSGKERTRSRTESTSFAESTESTRRSVRSGSGEWEERDQDPYSSTIIE